MIYLKVYSFISIFVLEISFFVVYLEFEVDIIYLSLGLVMSFV